MLAQLWLWVKDLPVQKEQEQYTVSASLLFLKQIAKDCTTAGKDKEKEECF